MANFFEIIKSDVPVLIDFSAEWCAPCKLMPPILKQVKATLGNNVKILKIDVDKNQAIAQKLQIRNVPTIALYRNGNQLFRQAGVLQANQLIQLVKQHI
ncbi:MAG: thioredoxin [Bacteroidales bacterium]|nr:thioredoxin [Bacteroidales bacterium]RLD38200.1 MAG: thioredoxin [Bacteroidota bacterium]